MKIILVKAKPVADKLQARPAIASPASPNQNAKDRAVAKRMPSLISDDVKARFWAKVDVRGPDDCWLWTASTSTGGYGKIKIEGRIRVATQVSIEINDNQLFPKGMQACHHCDNPPCVNPKHIFIGSNADNRDDAIRKGRLIVGGIAAYSGIAKRRQTHCIRGHPLSGDNLRISKAGHRICIECKRTYRKRCAIYGTESASWLTRFTYVWP